MHVTAARTLTSLALCAAALIASTGAGVPLRAAGAPVNAALRQYGARVSVTAGPGVRKDPRTEPEAAFDNNIHTRQVMTGVPYTFSIELPLRLPVDRIAFAHSDYETEQAPKDVEIALEDGTVLRHTLELKRPVKRKPAWQEVPVGKEARLIRVTVLSNYAPSEKVNWGGMGEIAVLTGVNLDERLKVPGYDPAAPVFVHAPPVAPAAPPQVHLPPRAAPGEHPCLLLTRQEAAELRAALPRTERGKAALEALVKVADAALGAPMEFPDPKGPLAQVKDRGDEVAKRHDRLSLNAGTLGVAYAFTGDAKYARRAAEILLGYAQRYAEYPEHKGVNRSDTGKVMGQRLSEAMWLIPLIESYDYLWDSGALKPADRQAVQEKLLRPAITFIWRKDPAVEVAERDRKDPNWRAAAPPRGTGKPVGNWLNYYNSATLLAGAVMGDRNLVDLAAANFRALLAQGIGSDGMWGEGAIGYQMFALTAMVTGFEAAARQGVDLWGADGARMKLLFDSPLRYAYPDGTAPGINDSGRTRFGDWSTMVYDYAYLRYRDPAYAFLTNASPRQLHMSQAVYFPTRVYETLPEPPATAYGSTVFDSLGYAILRNSGAYALVDYGPHGGVHGHYDKLNLVLFGRGAEKGEELGGEPVFHRYEDPLHDQWTVQTVAHNTLTVDESSQVPCAGKLLVFEDGPGMKGVRAEALAAPGALLDRTVLLADDLVLDLYHGRSAYRRTWDRTFRYHGTMTPAPTPGRPLGARDGYQHLKAADPLPVEQAWKAAWTTPAGRLDLTLAGAPGQQVIPAEGPDREQMALARQSGERADFGAVLALKGWGSAVKSARLVPPGSVEASALEVEQEDGTLTKVVVARGRPGAEWQALGWRSDARVLCVCRRGAELRVLLGGGTFVRADGSDPKDGALELRRPAAGNYAAERRGDRLELLSEWTPAP